MPEQIYIGNFGKGRITDRLPFNIDNDSFPTMYNFYVWRGRAKRKRGTLLLGQLQIQVSISDTPANWQKQSFALIGGAGNLINQFSLGASAAIAPMKTSLTVSGDQTYTDINGIGTLSGSSGGTGTINYVNGTFTVSGSVTGTVTGNFSYFPQNPVMGLEDFFPYNSTSPYPLLLAFDTTNSYQIRQLATPFFYNVNYYKGTNTPFVWSGQDYQQFWTTNYSQCLWATNGSPGFNFVSATYTSGSGTADITFNFTTVAGVFTKLIVGDKIWFNEWGGGSTINGLVGTVSNIAGAAGGNYVVTFTGSQTVTGSGIGQLLTNTVPGQDGIKWYDGDPTNGTGLPTGTGLGWVNFSPPLSATSVSIDRFPAAMYYLVGALAILPYKDRLLFFGPYIQTSSGAPIQLQDTVLWSWNGTPFYTTPTPSTETSDISAYYVDQTGKGGYLAAGIQQPIVTLTNNEDVLLVGFTGKQTRFVYTGNDIDPFLFFSINSELGSSATFSGITLDRGGLTIGTYGIAMTTQQSSQRIDLDIPDNVFQISANNNGVQRVNSARDFYKEWIYFTYPVSQIAHGDGSVCKFPTQTLLFNYRDNTWGVLYENYTAQGSYRAVQKKTWRSIGYATWNQWREPWNSGANSPQFPSIIGGNPQGYVLIKGQGTGEALSGSITAIANDNGNTKITSINHCVRIGDYLLIQGMTSNQISEITAITRAFPAVVSTVNSFAVGDYVTISGVSGMTELNGNTYKIIAASGTAISLDVDSSSFSIYTSGGEAQYTFFGLNSTIGKVILTADDSTFTIDLPFLSGPYTGLGKFARLSQPLIQTKQFPVYWNEGRQVRLSVQKYLMDFTANAQVTVNLYLSQDPVDAWNNPINNAPPSSLVYSQILYTCPESTNIGLTPENTNLQMPTAASQFQIWHRFNTSLIGDSFQVGITLSDEQMRVLDYATAEVTLQGMQFTVDRGPHLA